MRTRKFPITPVAQSRLSEVDFDRPGFGAVFADHMFSMHYADGVWQPGEIEPYGPLALEPGVAMLHYGQTVFDGYKAFRGEDGAARIFRPEMNARRLHNSCQRLCIPIMPLEELNDIITQATCELVELDHAWIPSQSGQSLYIRPLIIGTEATLEVRAANRYQFIIMTSPVGSYFTDLEKGVSLRVEDRYTRAASVGGLGTAKTAANYAASLLPAHESRQRGFDQVLWLDSNEHRFIEEVGAMNIFFKIAGEVVTPPLGGSILPGVMRDSVLTLLREWGLPVSERPIEISELVEAFRSGQVEEIFGAGTAAVICPVASIGYQDDLFEVPGASPGVLTRRLYEEITGIQTGRLPDRHHWNLRVALPA